MDLALALRDAKPNDTISIPGGRYTGILDITKPVTLLARGQVVLDAKHAGPCVRIRCEGLVRISGCTIVGGEATIEEIFPQGDDTAHLAAADPVTDAG